MQNLEIRDDIYERFLAFKVKHNPTLSNDEFIEFLMTQFENCSSKVLCNGFKHDPTDNSRIKDDQAIEDTQSSKDLENNLNDNCSSEEKEKENISVQIFTCPECKFVSGNQKEIEQHFDICHDMTGVFPCTCGQCFNNMSQFLAHYIICPIAATDLQNDFMVEEPLEDISLIDEEKEITELTCGSPSPILQSRDPSFVHSDDSNDQPLDFHVQSPSYSNPLNLVKNEHISINQDTIVTDYSINAIHTDNNNSSNYYKTRLPENIGNNASSIAASSPGNTEKPKKPGKIYECEHCEKNFKSKGLLDQHKHLHFPPRHECEFCGRRFRWPPQFYTHKQQCSKRKISIVESPEVNSLKNNNYNLTPTTCAFNNITDGRVQQPQITEQCLCGYKSSILTDIYEHKRSCVTSARAMILQKIIDYKSIQTSTLLTNIPNLNGSTISTASLHSVMQNFVPSITTSVTNNSTYAVLSGVDNISPPSIISVTSSQTPKLQDLKPFECDFCESRFMTKISLKQHLDGKHSDQAKYCCEKCGKGYFWNASYNYHKKKCAAKHIMSDLALNGVRQ